MHASVRNVSADWSELKSDGLADWSVSACDSEADRKKELLEHKLHVLPGLDVV